MPISKSAKKSLRTSVAKKEKNLVAKNKLKSVLKTADSKNISTVTKTIDKAAKNHLISKNKASRLKSQLAKKFKAGAKKTVSKPTKKSIKKTTKKTK